VTIEIPEARIENLDFRVEKWVTKSLNTRIRNSLQRAGIHTVCQLTELTRSEVEAVPGIKIVCMVVIEKKLKQMKLRLKEKRS
jgi:DNA-directed RNA polymerase alpha subunit